HHRRSAAGNGRFGWPGSCAEGFLGAGERDGYSRRAGGPGRGSCPAATARVVTDHETPLPRLVRATRSAGSELRSPDAVPRSFCPGRDDRYRVELPVAAGAAAVSAGRALPGNLPADGDV